MRVLALLLALAPAAAAAEGARMVFSCSELATCDAAGLCESGGAAEVSFTLSPDTVGPDGGGLFKIAYGNAEAEAQGMSGYGPFLWTFDGRENTLLFSSETNLLWHVLDLSAGEATVSFLACGVTR